MDTHFRIEIKMWLHPNHEVWFTLKPFRASANARCPEPHYLEGHWTCLECLRGLMAVDGDGWIMDGWADGRVTDGWIVCMSVYSIE